MQSASNNTYLSKNMLSLYQEERQKKQQSKGPVAEN